MKRILLQGLGLALVLYVGFKGGASILTHKSEASTHYEITLDEIGLTSIDSSYVLPASKLVKHEDSGRGSEFKQKEFTLKDLVNDMAIIHFWGPNCGPCKRELPSYNAFAIKYPQIKHIPLVIARTNSIKPSELRSLLDNFGGNNLPLITASHKTFEGFFDVSVMPTTILIGKNNKIIGKIEGPIDWDDPKTAELIVKALKHPDKYLSKEKHD